MAADTVGLTVDQEALYARYAGIFATIKEQGGGTDVVAMRTLSEAADQLAVLGRVPEDPEARARYWGKVGILAVAFAPYSGSYRGRRAEDVGLLRIDSMVAAAVRMGSLASGHETALGTVIDVRPSVMSSGVLALVNYSMPEAGGRRQFSKLLTESIGADGQIKPELEAVLNLGTVAIPSPRKAS
jgi:hypothetical protein